jgi:hypothetical protein
MNPQEDDKYFFHGKWFKTSEETFKYAHEWQNMRLDQESAERIMKDLSNDVVANVFFRKRELTNKQFSDLVEKLFMKAIRLMEGTDHE